MKYRLCPSLTMVLAGLALMLLTTCERDWNNPWDEFNNLSPEAWAPQNLLIEDVSITEKKLTWTYGDYNIEGFKIDRKQGSEPWQVAYQSFPKETSSWSDTEIIPDPSLTYEYRVYAFAGKQISAQPAASAIADFESPTSLAIEKLTDKSYKLTWTDNSTGEQGFKIDRKIDEGNWTTAFSTLAANQTSFIDTNVFRATNVEYKVYGFYESYESSKITIAASAELVAPTDLQIEKISDKSLQLSWTDNSNSEEGYKIDRKIDNGDWVPAYGIVAPNQITFVDTNVFRAVNIEYQVYAFAGNAESQKIAANTNAELTAPSNLAIIQNSITSVTLNWQDNSNGEDGFRIDRKFEVGDWQLLATTKDNHFDDNDFELNTQVYYRVCAFVRDYNSDWLENGFDATIPTVTNPIYVVNSNTSVTLGWSFQHTGHEGFMIDRKTNENPWVEEFATLNPTQTNYSDNQVNIQGNYYYYRIYAFIGDEQSQKIEISFALPSVETDEITNISTNTATGGGNVTSQGTTIVTARGVCWSTSQNPTIADNHTTDGSGTGSFTSNLIGLSPATTYYVRAFATNSTGTSYGYELQFDTEPLMNVSCFGLPEFTDPRDGNIYQTVQIGEQCWMRENLAYLPTISSSTSGSLTSPYYYVYGYGGDNIEEAIATQNYQIFGVLYNWPAAIIVCPSGWHLPTNLEWIILTDFLGGESIAGGKMKESGTIHWSNPNLNATNSSGFTALPGGNRYSNGSFLYLGDFGYWWSSSEYNSTSAWSRILLFNDEGIYQSSNSNNLGFSVRCVRDY